LRNYGQLPLGLQTFSEARIGATPSKVKRTRKHIDEVMSHTPLGEIRPYPQSTS